ncbi:MAPEG family protein [Bdellovibrio sp. HCB209]|uniref:MAPEG family protein n=1 Tax=Bdellovibrio sp. HCB209 TaxID=3394354 RepID=UPI0039B38135
MSSNIQIVFPMCAMFLIVVVVLVKVLIGRFSAVKNKSVKISFYKTLTEGQEPAEAIQAVRHFSNLFEAPVLFYVACIIGMILPVQNIAFVVFAWLYVAARTGHAIIHLGKNNVMTRMKFYTFGWMMLIAMWIMITIKAISIATTV